MLRAGPGCARPPPQPVRSGTGHLHHALERHPAHPRPVGGRERRRVRRDRRRTAAQLPGGAPFPRAHPTPAAPLVPRFRGPQRGTGRRGRRVAGLRQRTRRLRQPRELPVRARRRAGTDRRSAARARRPGSARQRIHRRGGPRADPRVLVGPARAAPGDAAEPGGGDGLPRREQQRHRGVDGRRAIARVAAVDGPVRRCGGARGGGVRRGPRPQRRLARADPRRCAPAPGSLWHTSDATGRAERSTHGDAGPGPGPRGPALRRRTVSRSSP